MIGHCLVTGCSGFIGWHLVNALLERQVRVRGLTRACNVQQNQQPDIDLFQGDLTRPETLGGLARGIDTVIHAAGIAHTNSVGIGIHARTTLHGTHHLLKAAATEGVKRFVFISSIKAMPDPGNRCLDESDSGKPLDEYGLSRYRAEQLVLETGQQTGMHVCVLRPVLVYGYGCKGNLAKMIAMIDRGLFPPIPENGNRRSMVDVRDLVRAILLATEKSTANGTTCIITDGEHYSTRRIYTAICKALGKPTPTWSTPAKLLKLLALSGDMLGTLLRQAAPFDSSSYRRLHGSACYQSINAESALGFRSQYTLEDALPQMILAYRRNIP